MYGDPRSKILEEAKQQVTFFFLPGGGGRGMAKEKTTIQVVEQLELNFFVQDCVTLLDRCVGLGCYSCRISRPGSSEVTVSWLRVSLRRQSCTL